MAANRVIGKDGALPWHLPEDLKFFRKTTTGHPILMGRKTWESLGRPLPNRRNLILSRTLPDQAGAEVLRGPEDLNALELEGPVYIIGGAEIFALFLPLAERIELTEVVGMVAGDTTMPDPRGAEWREVWREEHSSEDGRPGYRFITLERI